MKNKFKDKFKNFINEKLFPYTYGMKNGIRTGERMNMINKEITKILCEYTSEVNIFPDYIINNDIVNNNLTTFTYSAREDHKSKIEADIVVKDDNGNIIAIFMYKCPMDNINKNTSNYENTVIGESLRLMSNNDIRKNKPYIFFVNILPDIYIDNEKTHKLCRICYNVGSFIKVHTGYENINSIDIIFSPKEEMLRKIKNKYENESFRKMNSENIVEELNIINEKALLNIKSIFEKEMV